MFQTSKIASTKTTIEIHLQAGSSCWGRQSFCMGIYYGSWFTQCASRCWYSSSLQSKCKLALWIKFDYFFNLNFIHLNSKVCEFGGDDCIKAPSVVDRMAHKYSERLIQRVEEIYNQLKVPCNLLNLPTLPTRPSPTRKKFTRFKDQTNSNTKSDTENNKLTHTQQ